MKKSSLILAIFFLLSVVSFQRLEAQDKNKEEKEKEQQMQEAIEAQKKAMVEQKKAQEEFQKQMEEQKIEIDKAMKDVPMGIEEKEKFEKAMQIFENSRGDRSFRNGEPFIISPGIEFYGHNFGGNSEGTTWEFSKYLKEINFERDYTFDVEPTVNTVVMSIIGDCKIGEIRIKITMPNGKTYSDIVIDEFGNLNWRKSFAINTENEDKAGAWKFDIKSNKAVGYFKISLQTY
jgi:hypothetical protein